MASIEEMQTLKEDLIRTKGEVGAIKEDVKEMREVLQRKRITLYGAGNGEAGIVGKVGSLIDIVRGIKDWQSGWREVTNYEDYRGLKQTVQELDAEVDGLKKYVYIGVGGLWLITILLQLFGPYIITRAEAFFR